MTDTPASPAAPFNQLAQRQYVEDLIVAAESQSPNTGLTAEQLKSFRDYVADGYTRHRQASRMAGNDAAREQHLAQGRAYRDILYQFDELLADVVTVTLVEPEQAADAPISQVQGS